MTKKRENKILKPQFLSKFRMEAVRCPKGISLVFCGIIGVEEFDSSLVSLKSHGSKIKVSGKKLNMTVFENNDIEVVGKVEEISFSYGKN